MYKVWLFLFFSLIQHGVDATLTPSGPTVSVDCGGQQTFTCSVTGVSAQWIITGLDGIIETRTDGDVLASNNRVTTTDSGSLVQTSTITITGFTAADDGGSIQCINQADTAVQGMATISVGPPQCGQFGLSTGNGSCPSFTFTFTPGSIRPSTVVISYQLVGDPSSAGTLNCDYPVNSQMCKLDVPGGTYTIRATPQNNCGSPSSTCSSFTIIVPTNCTEEPTSAPGCPLCWLLLLLLPLLILVGYSISVALVWHLYYKDYNYCQVYWCCCFCKPREGDGKKRTSSTEPIKTSPPPPPAPAPVAAAPLGEYADPKDVRKRKEENKIQYADLEFTKQSGGGQGSIHQKEEPVTYTAIQHA